MRPPAFARLILGLCGCHRLCAALSVQRHLRPDDGETDIVPHSDWGKVHPVAQVHAATYAATIAQPAGHPRSSARIPPVRRPASPATQVVLVWLIDHLTGPTPA